MGKITTNNYYLCLCNIINTPFYSAYLEDLNYYYIYEFVCIYLSDFYIYYYMSAEDLLLNHWDLQCQFQLCTIVEASVVNEAGVWGLQKGWLTLHLFPQRQNLFLIILQALLVHILQPQFLQQNTSTQMYELHDLTHYNEI